MMNATISHSQVTVDMAVDLLRQLLPQDRLKVITMVLPEMERNWQSNP